MIAIRMAMVVIVLFKLIHINECQTQGLSMVCGMNDCSLIHFLVRAMIAQLCQIICVSRLLKMLDFSPLRLGQGMLESVQPCPHEEHENEANPTDQWQQRQQSMFECDDLIHMCQRLRIRLRRSLIHEVL